ncbi:MAG: RIP metalloprotease RseP [Acidobacteria bacterium]|nr:RIP metalloprotease RseP [Acidobacteriota bacterium]MBI3664186.1 RIP metalloprotease RseP [Acidobacteriota bacterium]
MSDFLTSVVSVAIVLGIMILVHEWGHFVAARMFGVRVDIFSIGFGPRIWGRKRGDTDYRLSALPLGGYVKMAGDNPSEERAGDPAEFLSKPRWQRAIIALAGPTMNILMSIILAAGLYTVGMPSPAYIDQPAEVGGLFKDSPAERAGIHLGDRLVVVDDVENPTWERALLEAQMISPESPIRVEVERAGQRVALTVPAGPSRRQGDEFGALGYPREPVVVGRVTAAMPADRAGLRASDQILSVNGQPVLSRFHFADKIQESAGQPIELLVQRGEQQLRLSVRASYGDPGDGVKRWQIGISFGQNSVLKAYALPDAIRRSVLFNLTMSRQIVTVVGQLFQGKVSLKQLGGPVEIARQSGQAAKLGIVPFIFLMAVISLNLGVLNLLPIPILDGGHILLLTVEGIIRRDLSLAVKERFVQVGMVFLLVVFAIVMYNDVLKLLPHR